MRTLEGENHDLNRRCEYLEKLVEEQRQMHVEDKIR